MFYYAMFYVLAGTITYNINDQNEANNMFF